MIYVRVAFFVLSVCLLSYGLQAPAARFPLFLLGAVCSGIYVRSGDPDGR